MRLRFFLRAVGRQPGTARSVQPGGNQRVAVEGGQGDVAVCDGFPRQTWRAGRGEARTRARPRSAPTSSTGRSFTASEPACSTTTRADAQL